MGFGGGIANASDALPPGTLTVSNCTFLDNIAVTGGGGIYNTGGTVTVSNTTLSSNVGRQGGGIDQVGFPNTLILQNTLVAGNHSNPSANSGPDVSGMVNSPSGYNLIRIGDSSLTGISNGTNHNQIGTTANPINARLAPLGFYGGTTQTIALQPGSPARDAGNPAGAPATDQRGLTRVVGGQMDIGAFQTQANPFLITTLLDPGRLAGQLSLREAVNLANFLGGDNTISFAPIVDSGTIVLTAGQLDLFGAGGVQTLDGAGRFTIDGQGRSRLFGIFRGTEAVVRGFDLGNGNAIDGGAILNRGHTSVAGCTLWGNVADNGGAIYNDGSLTVSNSTQEFGIAVLGAGIYNAGTLTAYNSTFVYNSAVTAGGAIYNAAGATATLTSLTISRNSADMGGGLDVAGGMVLLRNSIVAGNYDANAIAASDIAGPVLAGSSYNLIGTGGSGGLSNGSGHNLVGVADPGLTTPVFSSSQTPVFGFTSSSPALGAGDPSLLSDPLLSVDQHGNARNNSPNIGAL
jgi:hypothetical protein